MPAKVKRPYVECTRLRKLAERRHSVSVACYRMASLAATVKDRILYEEVARRAGEESAALKRKIAAWEPPTE